MTLRTNLRLVLVSTLCAVALFGCTKQPDAATKSPAAATSAESLAGAHFRGTVAPVGAQAGDPDELVFEQASFESTACRGLGFAATSYTESKDGDAIAFEAVAPNDNGATMRWHGTARGDEITATADWSKPGEADRQYRFVGQRVR